MEKRVTSGSSSKTQVSTRSLKDIDVFDVKHQKSFLSINTNPSAAASVTRRQRNSSTETADPLDLITMNKSSVSDLLLETGVYVANIVHKHKADLCVGDQILSINGHSLTNKTLYEIMDLVNQAQQFKRVVKHRGSSHLKRLKEHQQQQQQQHYQNRFSSMSRNRGFIVLSRSNLSGTSSASFLNQTIRHSVDISKPSSFNLKSSSNLIFNINKLYTFY